MESAAIFADSDVVTADEFGMLGKPSAQRPSQAPAGAAAAAAAVGVQPGAPAAPSVRDTLSHVEEQLIRNAMKQFEGNKKRVAQELGISRSYLYKRLAALGL